MNPNKPVCDVCGAPAVVHIGGDASLGRRLRHLCAACADAEEMALPQRERRLDHAAILASVGFAVLFISLLADILGFGDSEGFGWQQLCGVALAGILAAIGITIWIPTLLVIGVFIGILTLLADWLAFGNAVGFGWQQILGSLVGIILILAGFATAHHRMAAK